MAKVKATFLLIQCSPPKATGPHPWGEGAWKHGKPGQSLVGLAQARGGELFLSHLSPARQGGHRSWVGNRTCMRASVPAHTHAQPLTSPWLQPSQLRLCRAGEGGGQRPHSGRRGTSSQDDTEHNSCPETRGYLHRRWKHSTLQCYRH